MPEFIRFNSQVSIHVVRLASVTRFSYDKEFKSPAALWVAGYAGSYFELTEQQARKLVDVFEGKSEYDYEDFVFDLDGRE